MTTNIIKSQVKTMQLELQLLTKAETLSGILAVTITKKVL